LLRDSENTESLSFKYVFIRFLDVKSFFNAASDIVANHEFCQLPTISKNDPLVEEFCCLTGSRRKCSLSPASNISGVISISSNSGGCHPIP
jgi:hypothetical protein